MPGLKQFAGGAKRTTLTVDIAATTTTFDVADASGYPTGGAAPFVIALALGTAAEEKVLIASRAGNTLTVATGGRGYDGTTAAAHNRPTSVDHVLDADTLREANAHANDTTGDPHPQYLTPAEANAAYVPKAATQAGDTQALRVLTLTPFATGKAPFIVEIDNTNFGTAPVVPDPIISIGYNLNADGKRTPGFEEENVLGWKIEADYNDGSGDNKMEAYWQYAGPLARGTAYRPWFLQINRDTDTSKMELVTNQLSFLIPNPVDPTTNRQILVLTDSTLTMVAQDGANSLLNIRAGTSRTGVLSLGYNGVDAMIDLRMGASANFASFAIGNPATAAGTLGARQIFTFANNVGGISAAGLGIGTTTPAAHLHLRATNTNVGPLIVDQIASGAANMQTWRSGDATPVIWSKIGKLGHFITRKTAPALADLLDGDLSLATNANGDLVVTSRVAGVLKTATVAVA